MGGLRKYMPITYATALIGSLALIGFPGFSGFFSKDGIIEAVHHSELWGADIAYLAVLSGVFVTALYSFRMFFMTFHGRERMDDHTREHLHEAPWVVTGPLILLAIPSVIIGWWWAEPMLFGGYFGEAIRVAPEHDTLARLGEGYHGLGAFLLHGLMAPPFWLAALGVFTAWFLYIKRPDLPAKIVARVRPLHIILVEKYGHDRFNDWFFGGGTRGLGGLLWRVGDRTLIDGLVVNGSAKAVAWFSSAFRRIQTGYLYTYAFAMIIGLLLLLQFAVGGS